MSKGISTRQGEIKQQWRARGINGQGRARGIILGVHEEVAEAREELVEDERLHGPLSRHHGDRHKINRILHYRPLELVEVLHRPCIRSNYYSSPQLKQQREQITLRMLTTGPTRRS